jgi:hypothetical protein
VTRGATGDVAGVVLAAGAGRRLRPLSDLRPKALCPVGTVPLVDLALDRVAPLAGSGPDHLAVNAHFHADQLAGHCSGRVHVQVERPVALGTAGALGALRGWIGGRAVLVTNADAYLPGGLGGLLAGAGPLPGRARPWDGTRSRLLCAAVPGAGDFPDVRPGLRYVGAAVLPWAAVAGLEAVPSGLYEVLWRHQAQRGELDLVTLEEVDAGAVAVDCGTPADYLRANLHASGGRSVVGAGAVVEGELDRCVVWDGAWVGPGERLVEVVRAGTREAPVTVPAAPAAA